MKTLLLPTFALASSLLVVPPVLAADPASPAPSTGEQAASPDAQAAQELVTRYLTAVKAKKWNDAKKLLHPNTLKAIAERKKRLGREDHPMAPWTFEKAEWYLKDFKVTGTVEGPVGTFIVSTSEDNYQVQEKGLAEADPASYLVGKKDGKWYVVDKKRGETFSNTSVKVGYKGYFDAPAPAPASREEED